MESPASPLRGCVTASTALDFAGDFAVHMRRHSGHAARQNLSAFGHEFFQQIRIFVIDRFRRDVDATSRHDAIGAAKRGAALGSFGLHDLPGLAVECVPLEERIIFFLLQPIRRAQTFFVARGHVARDRRAGSLRLCAFQSDYFLRHSSLFFRVGGRLFFLAFARFFIR